MSFTTPTTITLRCLSAATAAAGALLFSSCATSGFNIADRDSSGVVSKAEFEDYLINKIYADADTNRDSKITCAEWKASNPNAEEHKFKQPDSNGDGSVTPAEARAHFERTGMLDDLFDQIDADNTGSVTEAEIDAFLENLKAGK